MSRDLALAPSQQQNELFDHISTIANWRKGSAAIARGDFKHYVPEDEVYVYFRTFKNEKVMVLVNNSDKPKTVQRVRFASELGTAETAFDVLNGELTTLDATIQIGPKTARILELK